MSGTWKGIAKKENMYRYILRTLFCPPRNSLVYESCVAPIKCDKAAPLVFRVATGGRVKALSTSSLSQCENKDHVVSTNHDEKTNADKVSDPAETPSLLRQNAEDNTMMAKPNEEPLVLKTDDGSAMEQQLEVNLEHTGKKLKQEKTNTAKSGKESLLDLLGTLKVEVTNKRKLKDLKMRQNYETAIRPQPAALESTISMFQKARVEASSQSETLDPKLSAAAAAAASTLPNCSQAESDLLKQLRQHEAITEAQKKGEMNNLGEIIADMKVRRNPYGVNTKPTNQIWFDDDGKGYTQDRGITAELHSVRNRKRLFTGKRLNIFTPTTDDEAIESAVARPTLWDIDFANQLSLSTNQKPSNGLEEMIQWTKEGKMWQYPINNEAGLEEEASVPFHEHIFLEKHLEDGFPRQGPVRHFMELVVAGLSKNPYLTVQQKTEHISWFRDYFHQKEDVLKEADVHIN